MCINATQNRQKAWLLWCLHMLYLEDPCAGLLDWSKWQGVPPRVPFQLPPQTSVLLLGGSRVVRESQECISKHMPPMIHQHTHAHIVPAYFKNCSSDSYFKTPNFDTYHTTDMPFQMNSLLYECKVYYSMTQLKREQERLTNIELRVIPVH